MRQVKTLGLLGTGVIGGGWAARALHFGIDVIAADVNPQMEAWIRGAVQNADRGLESHWYHLLSCQVASAAEAGQLPPSPLGDERTHGTACRLGA